MEIGARTMGIEDRGRGWKVRRERWVYRTGRRVGSGARKMGIEHRGGGWKVGREQWV